MEPRPLDAVLAQLDQLVDGADHFEMFVLPYTRTALTLTSERTDRPARPPSRAAAALQDLVVENAALGAAFRAGRARPALIPAINRLLTRLMGRTEVLDASHRVYANERRVRFTEMEYALPREHAAEALERVLALIERRGLDVAFPIELRAVAPDDAFLSTAQGGPTAYIAVHQYRGMEFESLLPGGRADHGRLRRQAALGQAPLPVGPHARRPLPGLGALPGRAAALRSRGALRQRLHRPRARPGLAAVPRQPPVERHDPAVERAHPRAQLAPGRHGAEGRAAVAAAAVAVEIHSLEPAPGDAGGATAHPQPHAGTRPAGAAGAVLQARQSPGQLLSHRGVGPVGVAALELVGVAVEVVQLAIAVRVFRVDVAVGAQGVELALARRAAALDQQVPAPFAPRVA